MSYFGILAIFLLPPLLLLTLLITVDSWRKGTRRVGQMDWAPYWAVLAHVVIAVLYTTPWDNYLVASNVWWYDPHLVSGITFGWVPLEEYLFFVLQTLLTGLWIIWLQRGFARRKLDFKPKQRLRVRATALVITLWLVSLGVWLSGWPPGTYLALIMAWALLPILVQFTFGADILYLNRRLLSVAVVIPTLYLWLVDAIAISSGTWTIDPQQTTGLKLGVLPLEEMVFFLMTNLIVSFGIILMLSKHSHRRAGAIIRRLARYKENLPGDPNAAA
jgi:lycopene beta-cyclase